MLLSQPYNAFFFSRSAAGNVSVWDLAYHFNFKYPEIYSSTLFIQLSIHHISLSQLTTSHSPLPTHYSPLSRSLLTVHHSPFQLFSLSPRFLNFSRPFHKGLAGAASVPRSSFFSISSTSLLQWGPPISSSLHILCIGMLRLMNS